MDFRTILIVFLAVLLCFAIGTASYFYFQVENTIEPIPVPDALKIPMPDGITSANGLEIDLYFLTPNHTQLAIEKRMILQPETLLARIEEAVHRLIAGPHDPNLLRVIPDGTQVKSVFWSQPDNLIYVNFSKELLNPNYGHVLAEWATIYAITNTVSAQSAMVRQVQILVEGEIVPNTHTVWDWTLPFQPDNTLFVRSD